ncbi:protein Sda1p [Trichomonascus vanleenenianus]|uniref:Sda1p n=1 Tax=Trichomonascus vanleenenianus TaxID=2268995 RepID=UPI003ECA695F
MVAKRKRDASIQNNPALLQNLVKRDPGSYREEFILQLKHYESLRDIFMENPNSSTDEEHFIELIGFIAQMCSCYPKETESFPEEISNLLRNHHNVLPSDIREKIVQSLTMLRNKNILSSESLIHTIYPILISTSTKALRTQLYSSLIMIMKNENHGTKNQKLNKSVQALMFSLLSDQKANGLWATKITRELWRRGIWDDSRTVEIMSMAAMNRENVKVATSAARFFLQGDKEREEAMNEHSDDEDDLDIGQIIHQSKINKKTSKREKKAEAMMKAYKKKASAGKNQTLLNFSAIHLLRDPQGFADSLFSIHLTNTNNSTAAGHGPGVQNTYRPKLKLEEKLLFIKLVSRLVGNHKLTVLGLYSYFLKYLTPKQTDVTQFMAACAEACHDLVPPDAIAPVIRKIADEFVSDGVSTEVCAAGINTITEVVKRAPLSIEKDLLHDLVAYKGSKAKSVSMAAKRLIAVFRDLDPSMLPTKERGKSATIAMKEAGKDNVGIKFGVDSSVSGIEGLELLQKWKEQQGLENNEEDDDQWEVASDLSDDSDDDGEGWVNVESDKEYAVSDSDDSDDDETEAKRTKTQEEDTKESATTDFMKLASTTILTPADFAKLDELKLQAQVDKALGRKNRAIGHNEEEVDADSLIGPVKYKQLREERIAAAKEGREDREFGSKRGSKLAQKAHSTTNREKARKKNFMMMIHKKDVQGKAKRSLRQKQKILRAHIDKQKKGK